MAADSVCTCSTKSKSTNSLLYLRIIQNKYISLYRELITQLCTYVSAIQIPAKGNLQLETVPVPILDENTKAQSYMHLQVRKPYITLNSETYISLTQQELRSCKNIGYEFYREELFVVKHKSSYSCESAIYFNLTTDIIKNNCNFDFHFNKTDITPTVLDGGDEIVLVNWPNDKHIICNVNNDIPVKILSYPYVLVNRSVLCNCEIEADNHYLLESIATCDNKISNLVMYSPLTWILLITSTCSQISLNHPN